jgi:hypothetical protein
MGETLIRDDLADFMPLAPAPGNFFMTFRDVAFWLRSARADARLGRLRHERGTPRLSINCMPA